MTTNPIRVTLECPACGYDITPEGPYRALVAVNCCSRPNCYSVWDREFKAHMAGMTENVRELFFNAVERLDKKDPGRLTDDELAIEALGELGELEDLGEL